jgi:progranulin
MRPTSKLLSLPASILFLIAAHTTTAFRDDRLPDTLPDNARGVDESADQRDVEARNEQIPLGRSPVGVMKMSDDPGQKFYLDYWRYEEEQQQLNSSDVAPTPALRIRDEVEEAMLLANASVSISYRAPFSLHTEDYFGYHDYHGFEARGRIPRRDAAAAVLVQLQKRQFECPGGTSACTSIGYPNSCCTTNETCFQIQDTGLGPVGCCPDGATCGGTISGCNSPNTPCTESSSADYQGGGCCIPNYVCAGVGCKFLPQLSPRSVPN